jgi:hypothetical protein
MSMHWIASASPTSGGVIFSSISSTFTHLQVRVFGRSSTSGAPSLYIGFNSTEFAGGYDTHLLGGAGSGGYATGSVNSSVLNAMVGIFPGTSMTANSYASAIIDILDYTNTNKNKTVRYIGGWDGNGSGVVALGSGHWRQTAAINRVYLEPDGGFASGSRVDLYGITSSQVTGA